MKQLLFLLVMLLSPVVILAQEATVEAKPISEKAAIRKERNTFEFSSGVNGALNTYNDAWTATSGGDNTITTAASLFIKHKYTKSNFSVESSFTAKFGYYNIGVEKTAADGTKYDEGVWFKNQDEFSLSIAPSIAVSKNWSYGANLGFISQFANGYVSSSSQENINLKSAFMSPGYLNLSLGVNYQCPKENFPIKVTLSPLALSGTFVTNEVIRENAQYGYSESGSWSYTEVYGVSPYDCSKFEGGSSVQLDFDRTFGKKATFRYLTSMLTFYGWISNVAADNTFGDYRDYEEAITEWNDTHEGDKPSFLVKPTIRWTNKIEIKATKYLSTNVNFELFYDRAQHANIQTKTILSLGVSYTFKNK